MNATEPCLVRCDAPGCGWELDVADKEAICAWHGRPCPKCGAGPILTDGELILVRLLIATEQAHQEIAAKSKTRRKWASIVVDSREWLR